MVDPTMQRIIAAAKAKGIPLAEIKRDIEVVLGFTEHMLKSNLRGKAVMEEVYNLAYICFACKAEDHPDCMNDRAPGLPVTICICAHKEAN